MITEQELAQHRLWYFGKGGVQIKQIGSDLSGANLRGAFLPKANLTKANLTKANLIGANLTEADLPKANLTRANLIGANLTEANLAGTDLRGADLTDTVGLWEVERQIAEAARIYALIQLDGNRLEMGDWHTCETTHCIAGWSCPDNIKPGAEASRKLPLLARFFFTENGVAKKALYLLAHGLIDKLNNLEHSGDGDEQEWFVPSEYDLW